MCDILLAAFGYRRLLFWFIAHHERERFASAEEFNLARINFLRHRSDGSHYISHWRIFSSSDLRVPGCKVEKQLVSLKVPKESILHSVLMARFQVWNEFLSLKPANKARNTLDSFAIAGSFVTLAQLGAFVQTTITCFEMMKLTKMAFIKRKIKLY